MLVGMDDLPNLAEGYEVEHFDYLLSYLSYSLVKRYFIIYITPIRLRGSVSRHFPNIYLYFSYRS
jgi:hypothetical protein